MEKHYVVYFSVLSCPLLLLTAGRVHSKLCPNLDISYEPILYAFMGTTHLTCSHSNPRWWMSSDPCGSFNQSTFCSENSNPCTFLVSNIMDNFYHCCTSGESVEMSASRNCYQINICVSIDDHKSSQPPFTFYGETLQLYVFLYAHPQPNHTIIIHYDNRTVEEYQVSVFSSPPSLTFEFRTPIPEANVEGVGEHVFIGVSFTEEDPEGRCHDSSSAVYDIPIISRRTVSVPGSSSSLPTTEITTLVPPTEGLKSCDSTKGLLAAVVVLAILLVATLLVLVVFCCYCIYRRYKRNGADISSSDSSRPYNPSIHEYNRLESRDPAPNQPSPNIQHDQLAAQNGTNVSSAVNTPIQPPSSLALGVQRSHSGTTPLIKFTPGDQMQPFPSLPSSQVPSLSPGITAQPYSITVFSDCNKPDATTSGGSGEHESNMSAEDSNRNFSGPAKPEPIYTEPNIKMLADGVELPDNNSEVNNI